MTAWNPEGADQVDFWTFWYLAARSSVSQYDTLRQVIADRQDLPGPWWFAWPFPATDFTASRGGRGRRCREISISAWPCAATWRPPTADWP